MCNTYIAYDDNERQSSDIEMCRRSMRDGEREREKKANGNSKNKMISSTKRILCLFLHDGNKNQHIHSTKNLSYSTVPFRFTPFFPLFFFISFVCARVFTNKVIRCGWLWCYFNMRWEHVNRKGNLFVIICFRLVAFDIYDKTIINTVWHKAVFVLCACSYSTKWCANQCKNINYPLEIFIR